jgi:hypothetical protein
MIRPHLRTLGTAVQPIFWGLESNYLRALSLPCKGGHVNMILYEASHPFELQLYVV